MPRLYPSGTWRLPASGKTVYLSFDDGPHPEITPWVLRCLKAANAKATFFCIGKNVNQYPDVYQQVLAEGHRVGNHTLQHRNGWKTGDQEYIDDIAAAAACIQSSLFRPPYGRIKKSQIRLMNQQLPALKLVMWDLLSGDFDTTLTAAQCVNNVLKHLRPGSIIVFHDSEKAFPRLKKALPEIVRSIGEMGYQMEVIPEKMA